MKYSILIVFTCLLYSTKVSGQMPSQLIPTNPPDTTQRKARNITAILGAFEPEVALIHDQIKDRKEHVFQQTHFTEGMLNGRHVVLAKTGVGKVNAAITTTLILEHFDPDEVVFTGIAGGINHNLQPGDLVIGNKVAYHDFGTITPDSMMLRATRNPYTMAENPLYFQSSSKLIQIAETISKTLEFQKVGARMPNIVTGTIVTGDVFVSSDAATLQLRKKMNAEVTEMEGASVAQACLQQNVPFIVIRSLSDNANNSAHMDMASFYRTAAFNSATLVIAIVGKLK